MFPGFAIRVLNTDRTIGSMKIALNTAALHQHASLAATRMPFGKYTSIHPHLDLNFLGYVRPKLKVIDTAVSFCTSFRAFAVTMPH